MAGTRQRRTSFDYLAPLYDWFEKAPSAGRIRRHAGLKPTDRVLDLGGGTGRVSVGLRQYVEAVVVCDVSMRMMYRARKHRGLDCVRAPAEQLPFGDATFDVVLVMDALHHFAEIEKAIAEIARVLTPVGRVLLEEPDIEKKAGRMVAFLEHLFGFHSRFLAPEIIVREFGRHGLEGVPIAGDALRTRILVRRHPEGSAASPRGGVSSPRAGGARK